LGFRPKDIYTINHECKFFIPIEIICTSVVFLRTLRCSSVENNFKWFACAETVKIEYGVKALPEHNRKE